MCYIIANGLYPVVLGSRILGKGALNGGMPMYKYIFNRFLTLFENIMIGQKLSEYHTGYRAFSGEVLRNINFQVNNDDFVFDNEMLSQIFMKGYEIAEITCPTKYFEEASSINFQQEYEIWPGRIKGIVATPFPSAGNWRNTKSTVILKLLLITMRLFFILSFCLLAGYTSVAQQHSGWSGFGIESNVMDRQNIKAQCQVYGPYPQSVLFCRDQSGKEDVRAERLASEKKKYPQLGLGGGG